MRACGPGGRWSASVLRHHGRRDIYVERAGELQTLQVLRSTRLSPHTSYEEKVHFSSRLNDRQNVVESIGYCTKGDRVLSSHPIKALFQGEQ